MSRYLFLLGLIAVPAVALTACDSQSTLAKAKPGECYSVVGKDNMGQARLAKTACAGSAAALAAACPAPTASTPALNAACPTAAGGTRVSATTHKVSLGGATVRKAVRRTVHATTRSHTRTRATGQTSYASRDYAVARSGEVTSLGLDYARVDQELAGGPDHYSGGYERRGDYAGGAFERAEQYAHRDQDARRDQYVRREQYGRVDHVLPPPPPPAVYARRGASVEYAERSRQSRSYSESYSSSSSASSRGGYGQVDCGCEGGGRGQPPHSPFDGNGYLTWRGKTPG